MMVCFHFEKMEEISEQIAWMIWKAKKNSVVEEEEVEAEAEAEAEDKLKGIQLSHH